MTSLDGKALLGADITRTATTVKLGAFTASSTGKYGRLIRSPRQPTVRCGWRRRTKTGIGVPIPADERILHINPTGGGAGSDL